MAAATAPAPVPVTSISQAGRYFLAYALTDAVQQATRLHPGWESQISDAIAAQTGWGITVRASGVYFEQTANGREGRWGIVLDAVPPSGVTSSPTGYGEIVPAQFLGVGLIVLGLAQITTAIVLALVLPKAELTFLTALRIFSGSKGPWNNLGRAAMWWALAGVLAGIAAVGAVWYKGRRQPA